MKTFQLLLQKASSIGVFVLLLATSFAYSDDAPQLKPGETEIILAVENMT